VKRLLPVALVVLGFTVAGCGGDDAQQAAKKVEKASERAETVVEKKAKTLAEEGKEAAKEAEEASERAETVVEKKAETVAEEAQEAAEEAIDRSDGRCRKAPRGVVAAIADGLTVRGRATLRNAYAVKSKDHRNVYFVSADVQGPGQEGDDDVATWATNKLAAGARIYSVDSRARKTSKWNAGAAAGVRLTMDADGAEEARDCAAG
jgi:predicted small secreted protein